MSIISDMSEQYAEEVAYYMEQQAKTFLERNAIKFTTIEETNQVLRDKGYRLIDEVENTFGDRKHTLLLVKVIDQSSYVIKQPEIKIA